MRRSVLLVLLTQLVPFQIGGLVTAPRASYQAPIPQGQWKETETETVWTSVYRNCDHGYFVILPAGVVGHGTKSPAPNHGIDVDLAAPNLSTPIRKEVERRIWVWDYYDVVTEPPSWQGTLRYELQLLRTEKKRAFTVIKRMPYKLCGLEAEYLWSRYRAANGVTYDQQDVIAYRPETATEAAVYRLRLVTTQADYKADKVLFDQVISGIRLCKPTD